MGGGGGVQKCRFVILSSAEQEKSYHIWRRLRCQRFLKISGRPSSTTDRPSFLLTTPCSCSVWTRLKERDAQTCCSLVHWKLLMIGNVRMFLSYQRSCPDPSWPSWSASCCSASRERTTARSPLWTTCWERSRSLCCSFAASDPRRMSSPPVAVCTSRS